jgi:hypothetical protein
MTIGSGLVTAQHIEFRYRRSDLLKRLCSLRARLLFASRCNYWRVRRDISKDTYTGTKTWLEHHPSKRRSDLLFVSSAAHNGCARKRVAIAHGQTGRPSDLPVPLGGKLSCEVPS